MTARKHLRSSTIGLGAFLICLVPGFGHAQGASINSSPQTSFIETDPGLSGGIRQAGQSPWDVTIGGDIGIAPKYVGSAKYGPVPVPFVSIKFGNRVFLGTSGLGYNLINTEHLQIGPIIDFDAGRSVRASPELRGLSDIQPSITGGGFIEYKLGRFSFDTKVVQSITQSRNGLAGDVSVSYQEPLFSRDVVLKISPEIAFANTQYERTWFGVTPNQSLRSGLRAYRPAGGVDNVGINLSITWHYSEHVIFNGFTQIHEIVGSAGASPIVRNKTQISIGFGAAYHF